MKLVRPLSFALGLVLVAGASQALAQSDSQVRQRIIQDSIRSHGGYCVCPYQMADKHHHQCGRRSLYSKPGGYPPQCYARDVDQEAIDAWRNEHGR